MNKFNNSLRLFPFLLVCFILAGCSASKELQSQLNQKDETISTLNNRIDELERANDNLRQENANLNDDVRNANRRIDDLERSNEKNVAPNQKINAAMKNHLILVQAEIESAGARFKHNDYFDINEHASKAHSHITAMITLGEVSGDYGSSILNSLEKAREEAEGLVKASARKQHNDCHDHHEHLTSTIDVVAKLME